MTTRRSCKRSTPGERDRTAPPQRKIKEAEFELLSCGQPTIGKNEHDSVFYAEDYPRSVENALTKDLERVVIVHRLREVTALVGYTRFDYISPDIDGEFDLNLRPAKLGINTTGSLRSRTKAKVCFSSSTRTRWMSGSSDPPSRRRPVDSSAASEQWCLEQDIQGRDFFGAPYVMLHSLSHLLINAISLECGYPASSLKERIYANQNQGYGILLYTAVADS